MTYLYYNKIANPWVGSLALACLQDPSIEFVWTRGSSYETNSTLLSGCKIEPFTFVNQALYTTH